MPAPATPIRGALPSVDRARLSALRRVGLVESITADHVVVTRWLDEPTIVADALRDGTFHPAHVNLIAQPLALDLDDGLWIVRFARDGDDALFLVADGHVRTAGVGHTIASALER